MNENPTPSPVVPEDITKPYRDVMELLSHNTDDFLYLIDFARNRVWFYGEVDRDYALHDDGKDIHGVEDLLKIVHPADCPAVYEDFDRLFRGVQKVHNMNYRWVNRHEQVVWINCRGNVVLSTEEGLPVLMVGRVSEQALRHLYNPLTGLWNSAKLRRDIPERIAADSGTLMLLDIDGLAAINLRHGREYGDSLLKELADRLVAMPLVTTVYHIEHNNFATVLDTTNNAAIETIFNSIQDAMRDKCTVSAGVVPISHTVFADVESLLDSARITLNKAKMRPVFRLEFFSMAEIDRKFAELALLDELGRAVENNFEGFDVFYQPQVNAGNYRLYGAEALLRFTSESRGRVFPDEFIPLLESSHLIDKVGLWVLREALTRCRAWREVIPALHMSVNFSINQFEDPFLGEKILQILQEVDLPGDALTVEITESLMLRETAHIGNTMKYLAAAGVSLSIDDFGMGYSNFAHLKKMNVSEIKIDRSFVSSVEQATYNYKLISSMLEFAKTNSLRVCCEGVESIRELAVLEGLHPDIYQGYLFDKPMTAAALEDAYITAGTPARAEREAIVQKIYEYKDKMGVIHFDPKDILRKTNIGLWIIRLDPTNDYFEMHADDTMERLMAVDRKYTPAECFLFWRERILPEYVDYIYSKLAVMMQEREKVVQLQYVWNHPTLGEISVRCNGRRVEDSDGLIVLEGYHRLLNSRDRI